MTKRDFPNTRAALVEYDAGAEARDLAWSAIETTLDIALCEEEDRTALRKVQEAFHRDTADINSLDHCYRADIGFMRQLAEGRHG